MDNLLRISTAKYLRLKFSNDKSSTARKTMAKIQASESLSLKYWRWKPYFKNLLAKLCRQKCFTKQLETKIKKKVTKQVRFLKVRQPKLKQILRGRKLDIRKSHWQRSTWNNDDKKYDRKKLFRNNPVHKGFIAEVLTVESLAITISLGERSTSNSLATKNLTKKCQTAKKLTAKSPTENNQSTKSWTVRSFRAKILLSKL